MNEDTNQGGLFGAVETWAKIPFNTKGSAINWILWVGLIIVAVWFWQVILLELTREI